MSESADGWAVPTAPGPVRARVQLPGSKSMTNRGLLLAALAHGETVLTAALRSRDTLLMAAALRTLGVPVTEADTGWRVTGCPGRLPGGGRLDVGNAGTVARFLLPVATLASGPVTFDGDPRMHERPLGPLVAAVRALGGRIDAAADRLPLTVTGSGELPGGAVSLDASASSQFVSALLLVGPRCTRGVRVRHTGPRLPSAGQVQMTVAMLRAAGARVAAPGPGQWAVAPGPLRVDRLAVEPDLSSAAPFLAAALVTGGTVRIPGWPADSDQPGSALPGLLTGMGAQVSQDGDELVVSGSGRVRGLSADLADLGELVPVLTALAAVADSPSTFHGVGHLRHHESDRLAALAGEIGRLGGEVHELPDGLAVWPRRLHGGSFRAHDDHRLVMAAAVLGLVVPGVRVAGADTVAKTLPDFTDRWVGMLTGAAA